MLSSRTDPESQLSPELSVPLLNLEEKKEYKETGLTIQSVSSEEIDNDLKEELLLASEEADNSSSHSNSFEEEKDHPQESIQFLNQDKAIEFLEQLGINVNTLPNSEEFLSFLRQILLIEQIPCRSRLRWAHIDSILERALQIPFISRSAISLNPTKKNQSCTSRTGLQGRSIPLQNSFVMKEVLFVRNLLRGIEMTAFTAIHYFFYGLLGYHLYQLLSTGRSNFNELQQALFNVSYNGLVNLVHGLAQLPPDLLKGLLASTATPAVLLTANGLFQSDSFSEKAFNVKLNEAEPKESGSLFYTELWQWLPIFPVSNKLQDVERLLRWEGRLSYEQKIKGYELLERIALTGEKRVQRTAMECLAKLAHSFHIRELTLLKEEGYSQEALLGYLTIKQRALKTLQQLTQFKQETSRYSQAIRAIYANYLVWWLGLSPSYFTQVFFYWMKATKITLEIILLINLIEIIENALSCPKQPGFEFGEGFAPWAGDYTSECFTARLRLLRNPDITESIKKFVAELSQYHLAGLTVLDLSQKKLTPDELIEIIKAITTQGAQITTLLLNNTGISSNALPINVFASLPELKYLDLSHNQFISVAAETFSNLSELQDLDISYNQLSTLSPNSFINLPRLQSLNLYLNQLTFIPNQAFINLPTLQYLNLSSNSLTAISSEVFKNLPQLAFLDLSNNQFSSIPENMFSILSRLKSLNLSQNQFTFTNNTSFNLFELQLLDLSWNQLSSISINVFKNLIQLKSLILKNTGLLSVPTDALKNLIKLELLDLSFNQINELVNNSFVNLSSLQSLILENNQITAIEETALINFPCLQLLDLAVNQFSIIPLEGLANLSSLQSLNLQVNQLTVIPPKVFFNLSLLKFLNLGSNQLSTIPAEAFANLSQLQSLDLASNQFTSIPNESFANLLNLEYLDLSWNQISIISNETFINLPKLQSLNLGSNQISLVPSETFMGLKQLKSLDFSQNQISVLPLDAFSSLMQLQYLYLDNNPISCLSENAFINLPQLRYLHFSNNLLTSISSGTFSNLLQLVSIDLTYSYYLTNISINTFTNLPQLKSLSLSNSLINVISSDTFINLPELQSLSLSWNQINSILPQAFVNLPKLKYLNLVPQGNIIGPGKVNIHSIALNAFVNVYLQGELDFSYQNFNDNTINNLTRCLPIGIIALYLQGNQITEQGAEILATILPCTNITHIDLSNNPANFTNFDRLTQENTLRQMCESQRCKGIWPDQMSCPISKPTDKSSSYQQTKRWTLFGSIRDTVSNVFNKAFDSFCNMLGEHARDVVASCPSYFDPNAAEKMATNKPLKLYWNHSLFNSSKSNLASNATSTNYINTSLLGRS